MRGILTQSDIVICHYPFHYPAVRWHQRVIVLSHGVNWRIPPRTIGDKYHAYTARLCKEQGAVIVANDTHFLRSVGCNVQPATNYFQEIDRNTWFIPNCVDTTMFKPAAANRENIILVPRNFRWARGIHLAIEVFNLFDGLVNGIMSGQSRTQPRYLAYMFWEHSKLKKGMDSKQIRTLARETFSKR